MARACRNNVDAAFSAATAPHPGLLLDCGLAETNKDGEKATLLDRVVAATPGPLYSMAYQRWHTQITRRPAVAWVRMRVQGAMIVGLGGQGVLETGITLQRAYGMPVIPGSALKGLARHYTQQILSRGGSPEEMARYRGAPEQKDEAERLVHGPQGEYHKILFGATDNAGYITYFDSWYIPDARSADGNHPLARDVITVHHPQYYNSTPEKRRAPWDFDDPNPISLVSARGDYLVAVEGPNATWADAALSILVRALRDYGVGGKTSSGYGRLEVVEENS